MKIAAIDIGTNSIRTIIAEIRGDATFQVIDQLKDMVRLGEGETAESGLTARAIADGLAALVKARAICDAHQVEQIITLATSAVREARNGGTFVELVEQETGLVVNVITAEEEARLIYLGARESARLDDRDALLIDIGGGSVELIIGNSSRIKYTTSLKLGVLRLLNRFPISDPPKSKEMDAVQAYVLQSLSRVAPRLREIGFQNVFVTSGTNLTLLSLALQHDQKEGVTTSSLNNQTISANKLASVCKWLMKSSLAERRHAGRIQPGRLDSIVMGAVLVQ